MSSIDEHYDNGPLSLAVKRWHKGASIPVLALHGWLDNAASFAVLAELLPECDIAAMDFAGHGHSDHRPAGMRYHTVDHVADALAVANGLGWQRFIVLGHSMGAGVATLLAACFPERVSQLIVVEGLGLATGDDSTVVDQLRRSIQELDTELNAVAQRKRKPVYATFEDGVAARMKGIGLVSHAAASLLCQRGLMPCEGGFTWRSDVRVRMVSAQRYNEAQTLRFVDALAMPVLLFDGENSFLGGDALYAARRSLLQQKNLLTYQLLPGGHHLHMEAAAPAMAEMIAAFVSR